MSQTLRNIHGAHLPLAESQETVLTRLSETTLASETTLTAFQTQVDGMVSQFAHEASNWRALLAMSTGALAYRWARIGTLALGRGGLPLSILSYATGLSGEVVAFEGTSRLLAPADEINPNRWRWSGTGGWQQGLASSLITFGMLKGAGSLTQGQNLLFQHLFSDLAMVGGHQVASTLHFIPRPEGSFAEQMLHAEVTNLQLGAGMSLLHSFSPGVAAWERSLDLHLRSREILPDSRTPLSGPRLAFAMEGPSETLPTSEREGPSTDHLLAMSGRDEYPWARLKDALMNVKTNPAGHTPKEREELPKLAHTVDREGNNRYVARWHTIFILRHFPKLMEIADTLMRETRNSDLYLSEWEDAVVASLLTENHEAVFRKLERAPFETYEGDSDSTENPFEKLVMTSVPIRQTHAIEYATRRGFQKVYQFGFLETFRNLLALSSEYDVFVGIARAGLFSASVADLLGLPNYAMEVHAHGRRKPTSRWVDSVGEEQISGKRVLLLDKDAVTGATVEEAVRLLAPLHPSEIGIYFNHGPSQNEQTAFSFSPMGGNFERLRLSAPFVSPPALLPKKAAQRIESLEVRIHHPKNVTPVPLKPAFEAAHARLGTPIGRMERITRLFQQEIIPTALQTNPSTGRTLLEKWNRFWMDYHGLNPLLPGVSAVRKTLLHSLEATLSQFQESIRIGFRDARAEETYTFLAHILPRLTDESLAEELAKTRYHEWGLNLARSRKISLEHVPHHYTAAFRKAAEAVQEGNYEIALIVGPEAFAYEPMFLDLGLPTVSVNIPETDFGGRRSLKRFEDLSILRGKRVLVVEDDVCSGATLNRLLKTLRRFGPFAEMGLYLGLPSVRQTAENIPPDFQRVFIADADPEKDAASFLNHLSARIPIYKHPPSP
ncbi:MAG: phosphoribosyltransferase [bacterium]